MKKMLLGAFVVAVSLSFPFVSMAGVMSLRGVAGQATVNVTTKSGGVVTVQTHMENNPTSLHNVSMAFDNVSGIIHRGKIAYPGTGMWIGFGGTALTPTPTFFVGNMLGGGVVRMNGNVVYDMATNTYTGTGTVVEFIGTVAMRGLMNTGWVGQYGTPGAGFPGGGWMPGLGDGTGQGGWMMPGWGGVMPGWGGMMGGNVSGTAPGTGGNSGNPSGTPGYMVPGSGGGMMTGNTGGMMPASGTTFAGQVGTVKMWVNPSSAAMITVNNGIPDHANPIAVKLNIMVPGMYMTTP